MKITAKFLFLAIAATGLCCAQGRDANPWSAAPVGPYCSIYDATHNDGNRHFYFRAPIVPNAETSGTFDPSLKPLVEICIWNGSSCGASLAMFNEFTGEGSEAIRVDEAEEHYIVNWHTSNIIDNYPLNTGETYRIRVLVGTKLLGYADLAVVNSAKELKNIDTDEFVPLLDGRTLPIKFRIEEGALLTAQEIMAAGGNHTCMIDDSGHAWCWGDNTYGQIGDGTCENTRSTPTPVSGGHTFKTIATGQYHTCAITTDGDAYCWGYNIYGMVGNGSTMLKVPVPALVYGNHKFKSLDAGYCITCGLTESDEFYCWGHNGYGQFGNGPAKYATSIPVPAAVGINVASFGVGTYSVCVLDTNQTAYCSGWGVYGQNGNGSTDPIFYMSPVSGDHSFKSISMFYHSVCAIDLGNNAWCWGADSYGQLGIGSWYDCAYVPTAVLGGISFESISVNVFSTCGISTSGDAYCWGHNHFGQLGIPVVHPQVALTPQMVTGGHKWAEIDPGVYHTCGITDTGDIYCWGSNEYGQLGNETSGSTYEPVEVIMP
ncbi:MAG: hypothetical protein JW807_17705 [Spirochaetes bacterium]|nr:hypothetical protein [Spirochaetota bacterium]